MMSDQPAPIARDDMARRETLARAVVREAGAAALEFFRRRDELAVEAKGGGQDVVSVADRAVEDLIRARIGAVFPEDGFLGEERGRTAGRSGLAWVIDPIDGTSCFLHGMENWCVSLALMEGGEVRLGYIHAPCRDELFEASAGGGARLNGAPIRVAARAGIEDSFVGLGANHRIPPQRVSLVLEALLAAGGMFVRNGSGALSLAEVACGRLGAYHEAHINIWDCAAGLLLVREAGGVTEDFTGGDLLAGGPILAAAPGLAGPLRALIARAGEIEAAGMAAS